jgi:hypothetical protein
MNFENAFSFCTALGIVAGLVMAMRTSIIAGIGLACASTFGFGLLWSWYMKTYQPELWKA